MDNAYFISTLIVIFVSSYLLSRIAMTIKNKYALARRWISSENMPREIRRSTLFMSEQDLSCSDPVPLHGRVDQVFLSRKRRLVIVDTKLRKNFKVYNSDIIQMSAYRLMLASTQKKAVERYGFVRVVVDRNGKNNVRYIRIRLISAKDTIKLWKEYKNIESGKMRARCSCAGSFH